jgi:hypothetical protein
MYKIASENAQRGRERIADWTVLAHGNETQTDEDKRRNLVRCVQRLLEEHKTCTNRAERGALGQKIQELQNAINAMRPKRKMPGVEQYFIDAAREMLPKAMFNLVMNRAVSKMKEAKTEETCP